MRHTSIFGPWLLTLAAGNIAFAQAVISTHSGVINFTEGSVLLDDKPLDQKSGTFSSVKDGSVLRTEKGRAEVLLTPGAFFRLDENSSFRMVSSALADTRVEFLQGSAILDTNDAAAGTPIALTFRTYQLRFPKPGVYRIDAEPGVFEAYTGEAEVRAGNEPPKTIDEAHQFFFNIGMETKKYGEGAVDEFSEWARDRAERITADNRAAAQSIVDPANSASDPFGLGAATPSYGAPWYGVPGYAVPSYGTMQGPVYLDTGFYGAGGPYFGSPLGTTFVIFAFPRLYGRGPANNPLPIPMKPRYPVMPSPSRTSFPPPGRTSYPRPQPIVPYRPGTVRSFAAPGSGVVGRAPAMIPHVSSPVQVRSPGIGAIHHR